MNLLSKKSVSGTNNSLILILLFITPYVISGNISLSNMNTMYVILVCFYIVLTLFLREELFKEKHQNALGFAFIFIFFSIFNQLGNNYFSYFNILAPFIAYIGYIFTIKNNIDFRVFSLLMVANYAYFTILYYSQVPIDLFGPEVRDSEDNFLNTSSNIIPCVLIINLYAYDVISKIKNGGRNDKIILGFAVINVILIIIQKSRAGIIVSILYLLFKLYPLSRKLFWILIGLIIVFYSYYANLIGKYLLAIGATEYSDLTDDARSLNIDLFLNNLDLLTFFIGFGKNIITALGQEDTPEPLFLNIWNYYGLFPLLAVVYVVAKRLLIRNKKMLPAIYLLPFLAYAVFEGFFFPNFWDFFIYLILFYENDTEQLV